MPNQYGAPEISVEDVADKYIAKENFILIDIRESDELRRAKLKDGTFLFLPMSQLAEKQLEAIPTNWLTKKAKLS